MTPQEREKWEAEQRYRFEADLAALLNRYSKENGSNTPDWILARYLANCLEAFNDGSNRRETWYGHRRTPKRPPLADPWAKEIAGHLDKPKKRGKKRNG